MNLRNTIHSHFVLPLLRNAAIKGVDPSIILQTVGLPEDIMEQPRFRFTSRQYTGILQALWKALDDEFFGMNIKPVHFGTFALFCELSIKEGRIGAALEKQAECFKRATEGIRWHLDRQEQTATFRIQFEDTGSGRENALTEYLLAMTYRFSSWLAGQRIPLTCVYFDFSEPDYVDEYEILFGCNYRFDTSLAALEFPIDCLSWPIVRTKQELYPLLQKSPAGILVHPENDKSFVVKVRRLLLERCGDSLDFPSFEDVADALGMSTGTLRRRLKHDNTSYQEVKDVIRRDVAIGLLCDPQKSVCEVAYAVGFSETSTFSRAFKSWTGVPPTTYRENSLSEHL